MTLQNIEKKGWHYFIDVSYIRLKTIPDHYNTVYHVNVHLNELSSVRNFFRNALYSDLYYKKLTASDIKYFKDNPHLYTIAKTDADGVIYERKGRELKLYREKLRSKICDNKNRTVTIERLISLFLEIAEVKHLHKMPYRYKYLFVYMFYEFCNDETNIKQLLRIDNVKSIVDYTIKEIKTNIKFSNTYNKIIKML